MTGAAVPAGVPQLLTSGQVSRLIRMSDRTVRHWLERGVMPSQWVGGQRYVLDSDLVSWAELRGLSLDWLSVIN